MVFTYGWDQNRHFYFYNDCCRINNEGKTMFKRLIASFVCITFIFSNLQYAHAQGFNINQLPSPGSMIGVTPDYMPLTLKGLIIHPENALKFDFLMDTGHSNLKGNDLSEEALKIMKYFLTALTIPEDDLWVNLSPYEKGRIVQGNFGQTIMGRDLLVQDYVLKQLTASLIYPEKSLGKEFWQQVYSKAAKEFGTTQIPVNTFNKVWIVPSQAIVWEQEDKVIIVKSHLKVMLEEDYLAFKKNKTVRNSTSSIGANIVRALVLPVLEKEVNEGRNFSQLRQMYQAMILATWYKKALKESVINKVYADQKKTKGVEDINREDVGSIYQQYLKAFKKGAFNYIKEDIDPSTRQIIPRKYFSGGFSLDGAMTVKGTSFAKTVLTILTGSFLSLSIPQQHAIAQTTGQIILVQGNVKEAGATAPARTQTQQPRKMSEEEFQKRISDLKSQEPEIVRNAISALVESGDHRAINPITPLLSYVNKYDFVGDVKSPKEREKYWKSIWEATESDPVVIISKGDLNQDVLIRRLAREALVKLGADKETIFQANVKALDSGTYFVIVDAISALISQNDPRTYTFISEELGSDGWKKNLKAETLQKLGANWWEQQSDSAQWWWITSLLGVGLIVLWVGSKEYKEYRVHTRGNRRTKKIEALIRSGNINKLLTFLSNDYPGVRETVRKELDKLNATPDELTRGYLNALSVSARDAIMRVEAAEELIKLGRYENIDVLQRLLERRPGRANLRFWRQAIKYKKEGYDFQIDYQEAKTHEEREQYENMIIVVDIPEILEIKRGKKLDEAMLSASPPKVLNVSIINAALTNGQIPTNVIEDRNLRAFLDLLNERHINDLVVTGGAVRDVFFDKKAKDIDIGVRIQMTDDERLVAGTVGAQASRKIYKIAWSGLNQLAQALNVPVERFFNKENPPQFNGINLHYLGPDLIPAKEGQKEVIIQGLIADAQSGNVYSSYTAPGLLQMAIDSNGRVYGYQQPLQDALNGQAYMQGDLNNGRNLTLLAIIKWLRLKHEFGLSLAPEDYLLVRKVLSQKENKTITSFEPTLAHQAMQDLIDGAVDPQAALTDLNGLGLIQLTGFIPQLALKDKAVLTKAPDHLGGIALNANMLDLQIKRDGNGVPLPISQQPLEKIKIQGFVPQIISIQPIDLAALLGLNSQKNGVVLVKI